MKKKTQQHRRNPNHTSNSSVLGILHSLIFCRRRHLGSQLLPLFSALIGCFLFLVAFVSFLSPPINHHHVHRLRYNYSLLDEEIDFLSHLGIWKYVNFSCSHGDAKTNPERYLLIVTSGGLNQQRTGITDAVAAAYMLNSTLVVPELDNRSYWKDKSNFSDIFDVDWFITYLSKDVHVIKQLPTIEGKPLRPYRTRVPRRCDPECYQSRVLPLLERKKVGS
ncbi:hypothetical protein LXL04_023862 [Taraxacum kok-saghyz]